MSETTNSQIHNHKIGVIPLDDKPGSEKRGLTIGRYFTKPDQHPFDGVEWEE